MAKKCFDELLCDKEFNFTGLITPLNEPSIVELAEIANLDYIVIDCEHGHQSLSSCESSILVSRNLHIPLLVRIDKDSTSNIPHYLDMGFDGVVVPHVTSKRELKQIINAMYYHPIGKRGIGPCRANMYAVHIEIDKYIKEVNEKIILVIQIEDKKALNNMQEILSERKVKGVLIGLRDLSTSLGCPGEYENPIVIKAVSDIINSCQEMNVAVIIPISKASEAKKYKEFGVRGFLLSFYSTLYAAFKSTVDDIRTCR